MRVAYVRVSTVEQNEARQVEALKQYDVERWFVEKISGKDMNRPELQNLLDFVREGDTVYVHDFSRLARSTQDLLDMVNKFQAKGVHLVSNKENLDTTTPTGKLMLTMIAAMNEFERANMLERQKEGIAIAKANGKYKGRKPVEIEDDIFKTYHDQYMARQINKTQFAQLIKVSRPTLDKMLKEYQTA